MAVRLVADSGIRLLGDIPEGLRQAIVERTRFRNPAYVNAEKYGRNTHGLEKWLWIGYTVQDGLLLPRGLGGWLLQQLRKNGIPFTMDDHRVQGDPAAFRSSMVLRPYQEAAVQAALKWRSGVLEAPCGSGKTTVGLEIVARLGVRALWLCHTHELAEQTAERARETLGLQGDELGVVAGHRRVLGSHLTIALVQSLRQHPEVLEALRASVGLVILDEAHHAPAATFSEVLSETPALYRIGLTATPERRDGLHPMMYAVLGPTVHRVELADLKATGRVMVPRVVQVATSFRTAADDYRDILTALTHDETRNALILDAVEAEVDAGRYGLVLSERIDHCNALATALARRRPDIPAGVITGRLSHAERGRQMVRAADGETRVIFATKLADEGLDLPHLDALFLAAPVRSPGRVLQRLGRIMRPAPGKEDAVVYDFVDEQVGILRAQARRRLYEVYLPMGARVGNEVA